MACCKICEKPVESKNTTTKLGEVGSNSINKASEIRCSDIRTEKGDFVHKKCRQNWTNKERLDTTVKNQTCQPAKQQRLRSTTPTFNFKTECLLWQCC